MKILIAPDSFKGTLTSLQAAELISKPFIERNHSVVLLPVADGGEGTVDAFIYSASAQKKVITVKGEKPQALVKLRSADNTSVGFLP